MSTGMQDFDQLDKQLSAALERKPAVRIAPDFAARVAAQAAVMPLRAPYRVANYAQSLGVVCAAMLLLAMFFLAPWTQPGFSSIGFDIELLAAAQLIALSWWLVTRRQA